MAKVKWRGGAMLAPVPPTMVTCSHDGKDNVFTVAWTGITNTIPPKTYISVRPSRHSYGLIKESGEFAINLTTASLVRAADFCGVHTGAKIDKFERCQLSKDPASEIGCPILSESPLVLECRVTDVIPLGSHDMFLAEIVAVQVSEDFLTKSGRLALERNGGILGYAHGHYFNLGKEIGHFGFSVRKKGKFKRPQKSAKA